MVRRLVGFYEYGNALDRFDRLAELASEADVTAIDQILADHHEFDLFVDLPASFQPPQRHSASVADRGTLRRTGLSWVVALARVEFGAMVAGFTAHPDPYQFVLPESFAYGSTLQVLLEGVARHYADAKDDPLALQVSDQQRKLSGDSKITQMLAKSRRLRVARTMSAPLGRADLGEYSEQQLVELTKVKRDLDRWQSDTNEIIRVWLMAQTTRSTNSSTTTRAFVDACGIQLRAERNELASGTATVTNFPVDR